MTTAVALLAGLGDAPLHGLSQRHLSRALRKRPGHQAALRSFLSFVAAHKGPKLVPARTRRSNAIAEERRLRADIRIWRKRFESLRNSAEARVLVAVLIARVYALPITRVLALQRTDVAITATAATLWPDADALTLSEPLANAYRLWSAPSGT